MKKIDGRKEKLNYHPVTKIERGELQFELHKNDDFFALVAGTLLTLKMVGVTEYIYSFHGNCGGSIQPRSVYTQSTSIV